MIFGYFLTTELSEAEWFVCKIAVNTNNPVQWFGWVHVNQCYTDKGRNKPSNLNDYIIRLTVLDMIHSQ